MTLPPLLIVATLVFWGLESGNLLLASILAVLSGGVMFFPQRWNLTDQDFVRVSDFSAILFLAASALIFLNVEKIIFLKTLVIWQPLVLAPILLAQLYSGREKIIVGTRIWFRRKRTHKHEQLDFRIYYFTLTLISAAMANSREELFYPSIVLLFFGFLAANRGRSFSVIFFISLFGLTAAIGYLGVKGAETLHENVSTQMRKYWRGYFSSRHADPFQVGVMFGSVGRLKPSGEILLRLKTDGKPPALLKQASYDSLEKNIWLANQNFTFLPPEDWAWDLSPKPHPPGVKFLMEYNLPREKGLLVQPYGSFQVEGKTLYELEQNAAGIVRIVDGAPLVTYDISYANGVDRKYDQPLSRNFKIPAELEQLLATVTEGWTTIGKNDREKIQHVQQYFTNGFSYSLDLQSRGTFSSVFENFRLRSKEGHCEMYATATALLLRKIGIPSRYVTGFAVSEYSRLENKYIVRERHAHAWAEAYVDGNWLVVDTTPAEWLTIDGRNRSDLEWLQDILSFFRLKFTTFRIQTEQNYRLVLSGIVIVLAGILLYRIYSRIRAEKAVLTKRQERRTFLAPITPFNPIESALHKSGIPRKSNEPLLSWAKRVDDYRPIDLPVIKELYEKHRKLRFDPRGMAHDELDSFRQMAANWLTQYEKSWPNEGSNMSLEGER